MTSANVLITELQYNNIFGCLK